MALSLIPSSSSNTCQFKHDVFLSFRGEETRNKFTSHLHKALLDKKIETFIDDKLNRGDEISPSLLKAIEESQISIIIFSQDYASSEWCLEELVKILQCRQNHQQIVIPVFYEIDPSHVRHQSGSFAVAFAKHALKMVSLDRVKRWKDALKEAANLSGFDSRVYKNECELIEAIVQDVLKRLNDHLPSTDTSSHLVGIDSKIKHIESLLCLGSEDVRSVGLCGMGGIGKTTLGRAVFNKISFQFEASHFIENVNEELVHRSGLNRLRQELLYAILGDENINRGASIVGRNFTRNRLGRKKFLIVFDDVFDLGQIESLIEDFDCFNPQSRIIITTRDKQVLRSCRVDRKYEVEELIHHGALELFCRHAFEKNQHPTEDYMELSYRVTRYTSGVPLALKVLGSHLLGKGKEGWKSVIDKLETISNGKIHQILKISYDGLDDEVKQIFLDIGCFFKESEFDPVKSFLDACGFHTHDGIDILINKSLIAISGNKITMHDLIQAMAKEIVRQECPEDPGKRSRLWHHEDICRVLTKNTGTEKIEGISLDMSKISDIYLNPSAFANISKLRVLKIFNTHININKVHVPQVLETNFLELRYFMWHGCPIKSPLSSFCLENLVKLDMSYSKIEQLWNGCQPLVKLKEVNLSFSSLISCPDFSGSLNLKRLDLQNCNELREISPSIQYLSKLDFLQLHGCCSLKGIPDCSGLNSLKTLDLSRCSNLEMLHEMPCNIEVLRLDGTAIEELPLSTENLSRLWDLHLRGCKRLKSLPSSICKWKSLNHLDIGGCSKLNQLPNDIGALESLETLHVAGDPEVSGCRVWFLKSGDLSKKINAVLVMKDVVSSDKRKAKVLSKIEGAMEALFKLIKEPICPASTKASLMIIYQVVMITSSATNERIVTNFLEMGLVSSLLEILVDSNRSICEKSLGILDGICSTKNGRANAYNNALTVPVVVKKILRVSELATEFSVSILWKLCKNEKRDDKRALDEALQAGAFQKLLLLLQVGCVEKTKEKATELLKLLNLNRNRLSECIY